MVRMDGWRPFLLACLHISLSLSWCCSSLLDFVVLTSLLQRPPVPAEPPGGCSAAQTAGRGALCSLCRPVRRLLAKWKPAWDRHDPEAVYKADAAAPSRTNRGVAVSRG